MKIIKNILIGLGAIFVLFMVLAIFLFGETSDFKDKHEQFVKDFTSEFSQQWNINTVNKLLTNDMLTQISTPNGRHALNAFKSLGKLIEINDMEIHNYNTNSSGIATGVFKFKASFENANTLVTVTLQAKDSNVRVHSFHIDPISKISTPKEAKA